MSNALAIAAVTAVLKNMLVNALSQVSVSTTIQFSTLPPQQINAEASSQPRLNLFLYQVTPNSGWRNVGLPSHSSAGDQVAVPPLALDLHYMLTAYGKQDFEAEILLGYAMQQLHETPVLSRERIRHTFTPTSPDSGGLLPDALKALTAADLAEQVEQIKLTPQPMSAEDISKLWTAFQVGYRPSVLYQASVVLIESARPTRSPLPVLSIGKVDEATRRPAGISAQPNLQLPLPPLPTLVEVLPPNKQPAVRMGEALILRGYLLYDNELQVRVRFTHVRSGSMLELTPDQDSSPTGLQVQIPSKPVPDSEHDPSPQNPDNWRAGVYSVAVVFRKGDAIVRESNELPLILAPKLLSPEYQRNGDKLVVTVTCAPKVWWDQRALLVIGDREAVATSPVANSGKIDNLTFEYESKDIAAGEQWLRLRIDGVESLLIDLRGSIPAFDRTQQVSL